MMLSSMNLLLAAEEATVNAAQTQGPTAWQGWLVFLAILAIIVVPFLLGNLIASWLKMRAYGTRIGVVLFTITLALGPFVARMVSGDSPFNAVKNALSWGIDLAGGTNMVYQVDKRATEAEGKQITNEVMDRMVSAVGRRVNPTGTEEVTVRKVGNDRIEVIVPGADREKVEQTKRQIVNLGKLEFALLAHERDHAQLIELANSQGPDVRDIFQNGKLVGMWRPSAIDSEGKPKAEPGDGVHVRQRMVNGEPVLEFLVVVDPDESRRITGRLLNSARPQQTDRGLSVGFTFNTKGGQLFQNLTSRYQPQPGAGYKSRLAVVLNDEIHSAPTINAVIGATGVIEGGFTAQEIDDLVNVLNAGALEVPLVEQPVSEFTVSPTLGTDVQRKGMQSMAISLVAVFIVTIGYYLVAGVVAAICLLLNLVLVLGAMALMNATFTLPGLAGLVLSIGMAVDANVLIFERMREERQKGSSLRMAIKNGFEKAYSTIFDSNVTTLITAVVLYYVGTDQVKGFAVTLFVGVTISMFTAVYVGRLIFDIAEHKRWITDVKMFSVIKPTKFDFLSARHLYIGASLVLIGVGLAAVGMRGQENFDIDFRGGSMVSFEFQGEAPNADEVNKALATQFKDGISLERLQIPQAGDPQILFRIRTTESDPRKVSDGIRAAFADSPFKLVQQHVEIGEITQIPQADPAAAGERDLFSNGHEAVVTISEKMAPSSLAGEAVRLLQQVNKFENVEDLVEGLPVDVPQGDGTQIRLRLAGLIPAADAQALFANLETDLEGRPHFEEVNTFDSSVAGEMQMRALAAMFLCLLAIVAYLWVRFQRVSFGLAACIALVHDVLVVLGLLALGAYLSGNTIGQLLMLEDFKINLTVVAAFLTIIGYSLNDKIVVFDRVREVRGRNPALTDQMVNQSLNETLSRTLLTATTTLIVLFVLYVMGGDGLHGFSYCLILGIIVGTYSSIFIGAPALLWLSNRRTKRPAAAS